MGCCVWKLVLVFAWNKHKREICVWGAHYHSQKPWRIIQLVSHKAQNKTNAKETSPLAPCIVQKCHKRIKTRIDFWCILCFIFDSFWMDFKYFRRWCFVNISPHRRCGVLLIFGGVLEDRKLDFCNTFSCWWFLGLPIPFATAEVSRRLSEWNHTFQDSTFRLFSLELNFVDLRGFWYMTAWNFHFNVDANTIWHTIPTPATYGETPAASVAISRAPIFII